MTEEEKKAIEVLKEEIKSLEKAKIEFSNEIEDKGWLQKNINELDKDIFYKNTLLNLIEKQQKENEELKNKVVKRDKELIKLEEYANKNFERKDDVKAKYIPKDKIRDKLDEIMSYTFTSIEERHQQNYAYDRIRELLEEE